MHKPFSVSFKTVSHFLKLEFPFWKLSRVGLLWRFHVKFCGNKDLKKLVFATLNYDVRNFILRSADTSVDATFNLQLNTWKMLMRRLFVIRAYTPDMKMLKANGQEAARNLKLAAAAGKRATSLLKTHTMRCDCSAVRTRSFRVVLQSTKIAQCHRCRVIFNLLQQQFRQVASALKKTLNPVTDLTNWSLSGFLISAKVHGRDGTGQHFCSPVRPELTWNCPDRPVLPNYNIISGPDRGP